MAYAIRPFQREDAPAIAELTLAAIQTVGCHAYDADQVAAWAARHPGPERFLARVDAGAMIWIAADRANHPVAYTLLEAPQCGSAHLDMLYCHPDHTRKGLAEELLARVEQEARKIGVRRLYAEASELARAAFERAGYDAISRREFSIEHAGKPVPIHNFAMEKRLN